MNGASSALAGVTDGKTLLVILGLAGVSVLTRCFFFILDRPWGFPPWAHRALHYAPVAALAAVVVPEIVMTQGDFISTWHDARLFSAAAGAAYYFWRRGVLGTILVGMAVYLPLHLGLRW
ncbi:MAG: AzlD domain-containing protein [Comamonadaceae bacterium]|nr:MAG: AzlD domain-containing protein [Comamonadaceae bacterium]